jgi:hypothetical protein
MADIKVSLHVGLLRKKNREIRKVVETASVPTCPRVGNSFLQHSETQAPSQTLLR